MKPIKKKKVLIALDYNPTAQKVAEVGFAMARSMDAEVILLHVVSDPVYYASTDFSPIMGYVGNLDVSQMEPDIAVVLKKASLEFLDKSRHHLGDDSIQTMVEEGDFAEAILKSAKKMKADIIVLGTHSRKWLENIVMGSVAEKVLRHTTIPLFVVPTKYNNHPS